MAFDDTFISRYEDIPYSIVKDGDNSIGVITGFRETFQPEPFSYIRYRIRDGDTFQDLATRAYGAPEYWYVIADANTWIQYPLDIINYVGEEIILPSKSFIQLGL